MKKDLVPSIFKLNFINNYEVVTNENKTKDIVINYIMGNKDILPYSRTNMFRVEKQVKTQLETLKNMFIFDITHFGIGSICSIALALVCFIFTVASSGVLAGLSLAALLSLTGFSVKQFKKMKDEYDFIKKVDYFEKNKEVFNGENIKENELEKEEPTHRLSYSDIDNMSYKQLKEAKKGLEDLGYVQKEEHIQNKQHIRL